MSLKLPETVRIGSIDYSISYKEGLSSSDALWGEIKYGINEINIDASLPLSRVREVLAHEVTHGILFEAGYEDHTEELAARLGKVLAMVLRDNDFGFMKEDE